MVDIWRGAALREGSRTPLPDTTFPNHQRKLVPMDRLTEPHPVDNQISRHPTRQVCSKVERRSRAFPHGAKGSGQSMQAPPAPYLRSAALPSGWTPRNACRPASNSTRQLTDSAIGLTARHVCRAVRTRPTLHTTRLAARTRSQRGIPVPMASAGGPPCVSASANSCRYN